MWPNWWPSIWNRETRAGSGPAPSEKTLGDWVRFRRLPDGTGVIEAIEPRVRALSRRAPTPRGEYEQIIIANPDQAVIVFAAAQPEPKLGMLDRFLVIAEKQDIPPLPCAGKSRYWWGPRAWASPACSTPSSRAWAWPYAR